MPTSSLSSSSSRNANCSGLQPPTCTQIWRLAESTLAAEPTFVTPTALASFVKTRPENCTSRGNLASHFAAPLLSIETKLHLEKTLVIDDQSMEALMDRSHLGAISRLISSIQKAEKVNYFQATKSQFIVPWSRQQWDRPVERYCETPQTFTFAQGSDEDLLRLHPPLP